MIMLQYLGSLLLCSQRKPSSLMLLFPTSCAPPTRLLSFAFGE